MKPDKYKICFSPRTGKGCGKRLLKKTHFRKNPDAADGYRNLCKKCEGIQGKRKTCRPADYPFFTEEILSYCKNNRYEEIKKFGYFYGIIIILREKEYLAFSILADTKKGSKVFESKNEAKAWLYKYAVEVGQRTETGLMRKYG